MRPEAQGEDSGLGAPRPEMLPAADPSVIYKPLGDEAVLFDPKDEVYFGLNSLGCLVWEGLPPVHATLDELCASIQARYPGVSSDRVRADVAELLQDLAVNGLVADSPRAIRTVPDAV